MFETSFVNQIAVKKYNLWTSSKTKSMTARKEVVIMLKSITRYLPFGENEKKDNLQNLGSAR